MEENQFLQLPNPATVNLLPHYM